MSKRRTSWRRRMGAVALLIGAATGGHGCGGKAAPSASGAGAATSAAPVKRGGKLLPRTKQPISRLARAYLDAAEAAEQDPAGRRWLEDAQAALQALESNNLALAQGLAAPPPAVLSAFRALEAWAGSGEPVSIAEQRPEMAVLFPGFRAATALVTVVAHSDDPRVAQALRFAKALRAPDNAVIAIELGSSLAAHWAKVLLQARKQPVTAALRDLAVTEEDAMAIGRALASSSLELARMITFVDWQREAYGHGALAPSVPPPPPPAEGEPGSALDPGTFGEVRNDRKLYGLSTEGDWVTEEFADYSAFWDELEALVANAVSPAELIAIFEQRTALAIEHPTSMLLRAMSGMVMAPSAAQIVTSCLDDAELYAQLLAGAPAQQGVK